METGDYCSGRLRSIMSSYTTTNSSWQLHYCMTTSSIFSSPAGTCTSRGGAIIIPWNITYTIVIVMELRWQYSATVNYIFINAVGIIDNRHSTRRNRYHSIARWLHFHRSDKTGINNVMHVETALQKMMVLREIFCVNSCFLEATGTILNLSFLVL